ncbi:MAG: LarC family nickel insertion protein [Bacteroidales bacterium]|nr:LarC family nickel insertion protein [Bacteroidales bacterium]
MELYINAPGGFAGDMFAAALISAGADEAKVTGAMLQAAQKIGKASVRHVITADGSSRMLIKVEHHHGHLSSHKALHLLEHLMEDLHIEEAYAEFGFKMLKALIQAEKIAHETHDFDMGDHHFHHHHQHGVDEKGHVSDHHHHHHAHFDEPEAWLHEAQDILIDIMGAVMGLQLLGVKPKAKLLAPVAYGGGSVSFSHGTLKVPAPATEVMIKSNDLPVVAGPIEIELLTPTGAAALTALEVSKVVERPKGAVLKQGKSRGTKDLPIPPLELLVIG